MRQKIHLAAVQGDYAVEIFSQCFEIQRDLERILSDDAKPSDARNKELSQIAEAVREAAWAIAEIGE